MTGKRLLTLSSISNKYKGNRGHSYVAWSPQMCLVYFSSHWISANNSSASYIQLPYQHNTSRYNWKVWTRAHSASNTCRSLMDRLTLKLLYHSKKLSGQWPSLQPTSFMRIANGWGSMWAPHLRVQGETWLCGSRDQQAMVHFQGVARVPLANLKYCKVDIRVMHNKRH